MPAKLAHLVTIIAVMMCTLTCRAQTTWTGAAGDGNWFTAANWSAGVPTRTTDADIPAGTGIVTIGAYAEVRDLTTARSINLTMLGSGDELACFGNIMLQNAHLTGRVKIRFRLGAGDTFRTATITGTGSLTSAGIAVSGEDRISNNQIVAAANLAIGPGITVEASSTATVTATAIQLEGTLIVSGLSVRSTMWAREELIVNGSIRVLNGALLDINLQTSPISRYNGVIEVANGGELTLGGRYSSWGTLARTGTNKVTLRGTYTGTTFEDTPASGMLLFAADTTDMTFGSPGGRPVNLEGGTHTRPLFNGPTIVTGSAKTISPVVNHDMTFQGELRIIEGDLTLNNASLTAINGPRSDFLRFSNQATTSCRITGQGELRSTRTGPGPSSTFITVDSRTTLVIGAGITVRVDASNFWFSLYDFAVLQNEGVIRASGTDRLIAITYALGDPSGEKFVNAGELIVENGARFQSTGEWINTGNVTLRNSATLLLLGRLANIGAVSRTGTTTINLTGEFLGTSWETSDATGPVNLGFRANQSVTFSASGAQRTTLTTEVSSGNTLFNPIFTTPAFITGRARFTGGATFQAGATVCGGSMEVNGDLALNNGCSIVLGQISGCGGELIFSGTSRILGAGNILSNALASASALITSTGSVLVSPGISVLAQQGSLRWYAANGSVTNAGTFRVGGTGQTLTITGVAAAQFGLSGLVEAENGGSFVISNVQWSNSGTFTLATSGRMTLGGRYSNLGLLSRSGNGELTLAGDFQGTSIAANTAWGNLLVSGNFTGTTFTGLDGASIAFVGGTHTNCTYGPGTRFAGTVTLNGGTFNAAADVIGCNAQLKIDSGTVTLNDAVLTFDTGGCTGLTFGPTGLTTARAISLTGHGILRFAGNGAAVINQRVTAGIGPQVEFWIDQSNLTMTIGSNGVLSNAGTLRVNGTGRMMQVTASSAFLAFSNSGLVRVEQGATVDMTAIASNSGTIVLGSGGRLMPGRPFTQTAGGRLTFISSAGGPGGIGLLQPSASGSFVRGGTLEVTSTGIDVCRSDTLIITPTSSISTNIGGSFSAVDLSSVNGPGSANRAALGTVTTSGLTHAYRQSNRADIAAGNQVSSADGLLTADDIIVFLGWFFASDARADVSGSNQSGTPDGTFTADDVLVFLNHYFAGC